MDIASSPILNRDILDRCLVALRRLQGSDELDSVEKHALGTLTQWLSHLELQIDSDEEQALDETSKAYLLSYRDKLTRSRKSLLRGHGEVVGDSPKAPLLHCSTLQGNADLAAELSLLDDWDAFDVFKVAALSHGRPLETVVVAMFERFDLISKLRLPMDKLRNFLKDVEKAYKPNPYHNSMHAADVTQSLGVMFANDSFTAQLTDLEMTAMIIATAVHDVGHPGVTNEFLINTHADTAITYNDSSVNENMHSSLAFRIMRKPDNNFLSHLSEEQFRFVRRCIIKIVLATDMAGHTELMKDFAANVKLLGPDLLSWSSEKRTSVLRMCVHCADIANPAKPLYLSSQWTDRVMQEFFTQGDKERAQGIPVSPLCDRDKVEVPKSQMTFLDYVVRPSYEALRGLAPHTAAHALRHVEVARAHWETLLAAKHGGMLPRTSSRASPALSRQPSGAPQHDSSGNSPALLLSKQPSSGLGFPRQASRPSTPVSLQHGTGQGGGVSRQTSGTGAANDSLRRSGDLVEPKDLRTGLAAVQLQAHAQNGQEHVRLR